VIERVDAVVVGGGVMGLATAHALRRAGRDAVVLEQFRLGHTRGSSHGATRIFRLAYDDPGWVRLAQESLRLWRDLEAESGEQLLELNGLLDLTDDPAPLVAALEACTTTYELLDPEEARRRFDLATTCSMVVLQPDAGVVRADRAVRALARGLDVREETRVRELTPGDDGVRVVTERGSFEADVAVVAAGAWAKELLAGAGIELPVVPTRETVAYFELATSRPPPSVIDYPEGETYALAAGPDRLKVGLHRTGPPTDPDDEGEADEEIARREAEWAREAFPLARPEPVAVETCIYTNTADADFVLERHGQVVVCSACSGHGFKFAPAVGRRASDLAGHNRGTE
jgi:sarcosine oxidase